MGSFQELTCPQAFSSLDSTDSNALNDERV
jgi:hypothetical protein